MARLMEKSGMKGGWRLAIAVWTGAVLALPPMPLAAQSTPPETSETPATDAVGPRELQNFSLSGRVVRPADQAPAPAPGSEGSRPNPKAAQSLKTAATSPRAT